MSDDEERWHVRIAPGEVKLLTLEQIDDLFRLDMIDENTLLRQDGALEWLPLRVVAGLDDEQAEAAAPPVARSAPPPPVRSAPPQVRSTPPLPARSAPPPPPAPLPPPLSERAPFAPSPSFVPPAPVSARAPSSAPTLPPTPSFVPAAGTVAAPVSFALPLPARRGGRAEAVLIGLSVLLGLLMTLHRNGALAVLFASTGQASTYHALETTLGGPGFGTPRAVDALVAPTPPRRGR